MRNVGMGSLYISMLEACNKQMLEHHRQTVNRARTAIAALEDLVAFDHPSGGPQELDHRHCKQMFVAMVDELDKVMVEVRDDVRAFGVTEQDRIRVLCAIEKLRSSCGFLENCVEKSFVRTDVPSVGRSCSTELRDDISTEGDDDRATSDLP